MLTKCRYLADRDWGQQLPKLSVKNFAHDITNQQVSCMPIAHPLANSKHVLRSCCHAIQHFYAVMQDTQTVQRDRQAGFVLPHVAMDLFTFADAAINAEALCSDEAKEILR